MVAGELSGSVHMWVTPGGFIDTIEVSPPLASLLWQNGNTLITVSIFYEYKTACSFTERSTDGTARIVISAEA